MSSDLPELYYAKKGASGLWKVMYKPDIDPLCYVPAREGHPDKDARNRSLMIANVMNATVDMVASDIRELLAVYEAYHDHQYHADWRGSDKDQRSTRKQNEQDDAEQ